MTDFGYLLEDNTGEWLLESSGKWLLEENPIHDVGGIEIVGTQSNQVLARRKIRKFIPTDDLIINICAGLITKLGVRLPAFSQNLLPFGIFSEKLRRSFIIPKGKLKEKGTKYLKSRMRSEQLDDFVEKWGVIGVLTLVKERLKRLKK